MTRRLVFTLVFSGFIALSVAAQAGVKWCDPPFDSVLEKAKQENKHIFVDFYAVWCGPCKRLDQVTYLDDGVINFLNSTVPVKYDAEKGEGEELAKKFKVIAYPTLVVLDPEGREVDRFLGYLGPEDFLKTIKGYVDGIGTVQYYLDKLEKDSDDVEMLFTLGMKHADAVRTDEAVETLNKVLALDPGDTKGHAAEAIHALGSVTYTVERYEDAQKYFSKLIDRFPDTEWHDRALTALARTYFKQNKPEESVAAYMKYVDRHPDDPNAMNGFAWFCAQRKIALDKALPVALKAVELSNRDVNILDTLAVLYYALGDYDNAIKIGAEAAAKDPDDPYLQDQLKKYRESAKQAAKTDG